MRALFYILFGAACGVVGTVLLITLLPSSGGGNGDEAGGGNARLAFDEVALAAMVTRELQALPIVGGVRSVNVTVNESGLIEVTFAVGSATEPRFTVDPEILDGQLRIEFRETNLAVVTTPEDLSGLIERPLVSRLHGLAGGFEYRLVAIETTHHRLTLEVEVHD